MNSTLKELETKTAEYLVMNEGTSEFDMSINDISRDKVYAMKEEHGQCWVGSINYYDGNRPELVEWTGQKIYNFGYAYVLPVFSQELLDLIVERMDAPYTGTASDYKRINKIFVLIEKLNGVTLIWS